ncbi:MAG: hypothetical protein IT221_16320 [Fluviicola sp.]|nr:hypothetical protein [Fluviicola sp.]
MRALFIFTLFVCGCSFAQSKKELRLQLEKANQKTDSLNRALAETKNNFQKKSDSLQVVIDETQKRLNAQYQFSKTQEESITKCTSRNASLRSENEQLKESLRQTQNKSTTKTKKEATDPFSSGGGKGNGNTYGIGNDNGEGGSGTGPGSSLKKRESIKSRVLIVKPDFSEIKVQTSCKIVFTIYISPEGKIVSQPICNKTLSTTKDEALIKKVADKLMLDAQYNKSDASVNEKISISIML